MDSSCAFIWATKIRLKGSDTLIKASRDSDTLIKASRDPRWSPVCSRHHCSSIDASSRVYAPSPSMDDPSRSPRVARRRRHDNGRNERARGDDGDEKWGRDTLPRRIGISLRFSPVGGANHSHRSRARAERRTVVVVTQIFLVRHVDTRLTRARVVRFASNLSLSSARVDRRSIDRSMISLRARDARSLDERMRGYT